MKKHPDMDEMIKDCEKKRRPDEEICFALGVGRMFPVMGKTKAIKEAMDFIKSLDGFIGVHPIDLWHNLLIFDTLNNAKGGRNDMKAKGIPVGQIVPILVNRMYLGKENR